MRHKTIIFLMLFLIAFSLISCNIKNPNKEINKIESDSLVKHPIKNVGIKVNAGAIKSFKNNQIIFSSLPNINSIQEGKELKATIEVNAEDYIDVKVGSVVALDDSIQLKVIEIVPTNNKPGNGYILFQEVEK